MCGIASLAPRSTPGRKVRHLGRIEEYTGHPLGETLFFDDEHRNIADCGPLGAKCVHVPEGMSWEQLRRGVGLFETDE